MQKKRLNNGYETHQTAFDSMIGHIGKLKCISCFISCLKFIYKRHISIKYLNLNFFNLRKHELAMRYGFSLIVEDFMVFLE